MSVGDLQSFSYLLPTSLILRGGVKKIKMKILEIENLVTEFQLDSGNIRATDHVSFSLERGKVLGVVGESGCGKTVTALSILRLIDAPGKIVDGRILYYKPTLEIPHPAPPTINLDSIASFMPPAEKIDPVSTGAAIDLLSLSDSELLKIRGKKIAMIFQEPMTSLNPIYTIGNQIEEAILIHQHGSKKEAREKTIEILRRVGISDAERRIDDYPHQMSGGMRQRVMIAMALSCEPEILIADEPTTALDVTIQAQILELMNEIIEEMKMSMILITHDLGVVAETCDDVVVMYAGQVVEEASVQLIFNRPKHPYTIGLLESIPSLKKQEGKFLKAIPGSVPNLAHLRRGCRFKDRCFKAVEACGFDTPPMRYAGNGQQGRCINY